MLIKKFELSNEKSDFLISIFSYDNAPRKLSFQRTYLKKDGSKGINVAGRLSIDDIKFLKSNIDEVINIMESSWNSICS